jgi:hypothetical protein
VADEPQLPSEQELAEALAKVGVADVLLNALTASISLGFHKLSAETRDLSQARLAIEALRALDPVLREAGVDERLLRDLEQARTNLQLAYAKAVADEGHEPRPSSEEPAATEGQPEQPSDETITES